MSEDVLKILFYAVPISTGIIALAYAFWRTTWVNAQDAGSDRMKEIAQAIREGFESVRVTIEQNYDQLGRLLGRYGLDMDPKAARRKAARLREARGWKISEETPRAETPPAPPLRLVNAKRA